MRVTKVGIVLKRQISETAIFLTHEETTTRLPHNLCNISNEIREFLNENYTGESLKYLVEFVVK